MPVPKCLDFDCFYKEANAKRVSLNPEQRRRASLNYKQEVKYSCSNGCLASRHYLYRDLDMVDSESYL